MIINCDEYGMVLMGDDGFTLELSEENVREIKERYEEYFEDNDNYEDGYIDEITIMKKIFRIVKKYVDKHPIGKTIGAEYVSQDNDAKIDAEAMFEEIMDFYASIEEN